MASIDIPFTTNAPAAAKAVADARRETITAADAAAKFKQRQLEVAKATDAKVAALKRESAAAKELHGEIGRLMQRQGQLGRSSFSGFRSNNPGGDLGGGGGGPGGGRGVGGLFGKVGGLAGRIAGIPGAGAVAGIAGSIANLGAAGAGLLAAAATLAPAALVFRNAAVNAEIAADQMKGVALGLKAGDDAYRAGTSARQGNARGAFEQHGDALLQLTARGGSIDEAQSLTKLGISDAAQGLSTAQLIDPNQRGAAIGAAKRAALLGEGSFSEFLGLIQSNQVGLTGDAAADVGALIGVKRGTGALSGGMVESMESRLRSGTGGDLAGARASRGRAGAAKMGAALDTDAAINSYYDEREATENPERAGLDAARGEFEATITALQDTASAQGALAARFQNLMAKVGMSAGSARTRANRTEAAARSTSGF